MTENFYAEQSEERLKQLEKGAFVTTSDGEKVNTMTIGWGSIGYVWRKPVFTILVRHSRFTHELLEKNSEFTVSIPSHDMKTALSICGSKSGRDCDKFTEANLTPQPGKKVSVPVIAECDHHYECKIIYKQDMDPGALNAADNKSNYPQGDYHTIYYGEIIASYDKE
ncbi:flavin reductase (DIM6/NTAB) family NADH-FMN oxidoreductase RutF [Sporomusaceae bacterium BoRhaA]|uniref:flavin reductase family protein n=1 Tax=Pelorhabdus rhamnosifermentans TaxID=2772457 RepID=UPI001C0640CE|nr:flavin reductase family protein [Pelorhabdus rhamnosifermentans]MBU2699564.1 flavin reductase (DIM6/NTAB) family NADH-FMN oxidoreductase RutF [Pelorhabdus rhamnosifermentans]